MIRRAYEAVVIGGSAGAVEALAEILPALPSDAPFPVIVVLHLAEGRRSLLAEALRPRLRVATREVCDKEYASGSTVWFAPPDYHLLVEADHTFALSAQEPVLVSRPSIDVLFESAAEAYGAGLVGVVLSGANADGARGLRAVREAGGVTLVQAPRTAAAAAMPEAALACGAADHVASPRRIGAWLAAAAARRLRSAP